MDDISNINYTYFENAVSQIYPTELELIKPIPLIPKRRFWICICLFLLILFLPKVTIKHDNFDFEIVNFPSLDGVVPRFTSYSLYISQLVTFARVSSHVTDFNTRNKVLTQKLLKQGTISIIISQNFYKLYP